MSTVCFSGSCKHIFYIIFKDDDGYKAEIDSQQQNIQIEKFSEFDAAKCWIKRIINEQCSELDEIDRYN